MKTYRHFDPVVVGTNIPKLRIKTCEMLDLIKSGKAVRSKSSSARSSARKSFRRKRDFGAHSLYCYKK